MRPVEDAATHPIDHARVVSRFVCAELVVLAPVHGGGRFDAVGAKLVGTRLPRKRQQRVAAFPTGLG